MGRSLLSEENNSVGVVINKILGPNGQILSVVSANENPLRQGRPAGEIIPLEKDQRTGIITASNVYFAYQDLRNTYLCLKDFFKDMSKQFFAIPSVFEFYVEARSDGMEYQDIVDMLIPAMREVYGDQLADAANTALIQYKDELENYYTSMLQEAKEMNSTEAVDSPTQIIV